LGHRHEPHQAEAQLRKKRITTKLQTTTLHRQHPDGKGVKAKTLSSPLAPSLPTMIHTELAYCQAGLATVGRCKRVALLQSDPIAPPVKMMYHAGLAAAKQG
jgi:hypothetical protein